MIEDIYNHKGQIYLEHKIQVEQLSRVITTPEVVIMDGYAILWVIAWVLRGTVQDLIAGYLEHILGKLKDCTGYILYLIATLTTLSGSTQGASAPD